MINFYIFLFEQLLFEYQNSEQMFIFIIKIKKL